MHIHKKHLHPGQDLCSSQTHFLLSQWRQDVICLKPIKLALNFKWFICVYKCLRCAVRLHAMFWLVLEAHDIGHYQAVNRDWFSPVETVHQRVADSVLAMWNTDKTLEMFRVRHPKRTLGKHCGTSNKKIFSNETILDFFKIHKGRLNAVWPISTAD